MLPIPIISTETWASCAETRQIGTPKMIDANRNRFIVQKIISGTSRPCAKPRVNPTEKCRNDSQASYEAPSKVRSTGLRITTN